MMEPSGDNAAAHCDSGFPRSRAAVFDTTHWSQVITAGQTGMSNAAAALEELCRKYWPPIYAFVRRRGSDPHEAEDLTQAFFVHLLEHEGIKKAERAKGKFRTFLLASLTNFLNNEWDKSQTLKRGGQRQIVSLDEEAAEERYRSERVDLLTPERIFERRWAQTLVERALTQLKGEYDSREKGALFATLEPGLTGETPAGVCAEWAAVLGMGEGAVRVALHRMRRRFGELLRGEIAKTVVSPAEVEEEIRLLFAAVTN